MQDRDAMQNHEPMPPSQPNQSNQSPPARRIPPGVLAGLAAAMLAAGAGTAWWTWHSHQAQTPTAEAPPPEVPITTAPIQPSPSSPVTTEQRVQVYWLKSEAAGFELVPTVVSVATAAATADQPEPLLKAAFDAMLQGSSTPDLTSTIPEGTTLRQIEVEPDGVHVDLSQEFTSGGGSASMTGRVGQVIYTATTLDPEAPVWLAVEGEPLEVLGGEGLLIDQPMTRDTFQQNFPL